MPSRPQATRFELEDFDSHNLQARVSRLPQLANKRAMADLCQILRKGRLGDDETGEVDWKMFDDSRLKMEKEVMRRRQSFEKKSEKLSTVEEIKETLGERIVADCVKWSPDEGSIDNHDGISRRLKGKPEQREYLDRIASKGAWIDFPKQMDPNKTFEENITKLVLEDGQLDAYNVYSLDSTLEQSGSSADFLKVRSLSRHPLIQQAYDSETSTIDRHRLLGNRALASRSVDSERPPKWQIKEQLHVGEKELSSDSLWAQKDLRAVSFRPVKKKFTDSRKNVRSIIRHDFSPLKSLHTTLLNEMPTFGAKAKLKEKLKKIGGCVLKTFKVLERLEDDVYASQAEHERWNWGKDKRTPLRSRRVPQTAATGHSKTDRQSLPQSSHSRSRLTGQSAD